MIRFGVVGLGGMGAVRRRILGRRPDAAIVAVADVNAELAAECGREYGCWSTADYRELCARDDVEAVTVSVPNKFHFPIAMEALRAGKHVFVEYPLGVSVGEVDRLGEAARAARVKLQCGMSMLFEPWHLWMKSNAPRLGVLVTSVYTLESGRIYKWATDDEIMGDFFALANYHVTAHQIDLFGPVEWVNGALRVEKDRDGRNTRLFGAQHMGFASGASGYNHYAMSVVGRSYWNGYVLGSEGCMSWDYRTGLEMLTGTPGARQVQTTRVAVTREEIGEDRSKEQDLGDFIEAIRDGRENLFTAEFVRHSLEACVASTQSAREGRRMTLARPAARVQLRPSDLPAGDTGAP